MDRRTFIGALPAAMIAAPLAAKEKPSTRVHRIGFVNPGTWSPENYNDLVASLRALGWVEGQNLLIERRNPRIERAEIQRTAEELVRLKVEIIVTFGTLTTQAAKSATTTVPIVIASARDPVQSGLVASLARPGGNITGFSYAGTEIVAKGLALLRELLPGLQRVGVLETPAIRKYGGESKDIERACQSLGLQPIIIEVAAADELENAISDLVRRGAQALFVQSDDLFVDNRVPFISAALRAKLPTIADFDEMVDAGALVVLQNSYAEQIQRAASFIDRILRGAKPGDLPIEQPTKFELWINLKTAKALGITVPQTLLLRADHVIQ